jgi:carotenoid cleavage dioxygenase-like enzyme
VLFKLAGKSIWMYARKLALLSPTARGRLLLTVFAERRNASYLAILDAMHIEAGPIAKAHLDHRVPLGFHGVWRAATV